MSQPRSAASLSYFALPHKSQLLVLAVCRFAEPVAQTSIYPYLYFMLRSYGISPEHVPLMAGVVSASFNFGQFLTGIIWGQLSDKYGRKPVLLCGLCGTMLSSLAFGFSSSLWMAILARTASGVLNSNAGVLRTMVAELVPNKEHHARAFTIMPMVFNIGSVLGPVIGGWFSEPAEKYGWTIWATYPYALPNVVISVLLAASLISGYFLLQETLEQPTSNTGNYVPLGEESESEIKRPGISSLLHWPIANTILAYVIVVFHMSIYGQLFPIYLSTPRPVGLALSTNQVGFAMTFVGAFGIIFQLIVYPRVVARIGTLRALRYCLIPSPIAYSLVPLLPQISWYWAGIGILLLLQVTTRTFAFPSCIILITSSAPPKGLGMTNGAAQTVASLSRGSGPLIAGALFSKVGGSMWYGVAGISMLGCMQSWLVKEAYST